MLRLLVFSKLAGAITPRQSLPLAVDRTLREEHRKLAVGTPCPEGRCKQTLGNLVSCDGGFCDQNFATVATCAGGGCSQRSAVNATCAGGKCSQTDAINPACSGGDCDQVRGSRASCDGGRCDQRNSVIFATCGLEGGVGRCDQRDADEVFCSFHCQQGGSAKATCNDHSCAQNDVKESAVCYGGSCDQSNAQGVVMCLGGYCKQQGAKGGAVSCDGGYCTPCATNPNQWNCESGFICVDSFCVRQNCGLANLTFPGTTNSTQVSFSFICPKGRQCLNNLCSSSVRLGISTVAVIVFLQAFLQ